MSKVLLVTLLSVFFCITASHLLFSSDESPEPSPPIPPLTESCFNKTFADLYGCQLKARLRWQNDTDQRQAFCCSTWEQMDCSFPFIQRTCNLSERVSVDSYLTRWEAYVIDYVKCGENLPGNEPCKNPPNAL